MKIDEREVPAPVLAHWNQAIDGALSVALNALTSVFPSLKAGFRPGKVPPAQLRERTKAMLDTSSALPEVLRNLLVQQGLQRQLVCVLSEAAIDLHAASWADAFGRAEFFSAMRQRRWTGQGRCPGVGGTGANADGVGDVVVIGDKLTAVHGVCEGVAMIDSRFSTPY
jgi:hypothetical protein